MALIHHSRQCYGVWGVTNRAGLGQTYSARRWNKTTESHLWDSPGAQRPSRRQAGYLTRARTWTWREGSTPTLDHWGTTSPKYSLEATASVFHSGPNGKCRIKHLDRRTHRTPNQYPLTFFALRLMELAGDSMPALNLRGNAMQILDWFLAHSERLEHYVEENPNLTVEQRRELATKVIQESVLNDEIEEEKEVIGRGINNDRVAAFASQIREIALSTNSIEHLFQEAGAFTQLYEDDAGAPKERGYHELLPKSPFMDSAENDRTYYDPIEGEQWGRALSRDATHLLCEALEDATHTSAPMDSQEALLHEVRAALEELTPENTIIIMLAGDWGNTRLAFYGDEAEGYQPYWYFEGSRRSMEIGRYCGHPILDGPSNGEPRLYVVDLNTWGRFVCAPFSGGQILRVEVNPISLERAQEILQGNKALFEDSPDFDSKLRKLQTYVEVDIGIRHQFVVADQSRARKITRSCSIEESAT